MTGAFGRSGEREPGEEGERERVRETRGGAWCRPGHPDDEGEKQEVAGRCDRGRTHGRARWRVPLSSWRKEGDDWCWPVGLAGLLGQNGWAAR